jgi:hypothetical protein
MPLKANAALLVAPALIAGLLFASAGTASKTSFSFGVSIAGLPSHLAPLKSFEQMVGRDLDVANYYVDFTTPAFNAAAATAISDQGVTPMITWEPWDSALADPEDEPGYSLATIIGGDWDSLLTTWAKGIAKWGKPLMLRFGQEMNGDWYPWSEGVNGNTAGQYVAAWRHVHDIFVANHATNVKWVWSPNVDFPGSISLAELYPGDDYVNYVGVDGYNWGTSQPWSAWQSPSQIFDATLAEVHTFTEKPIILAEVASAEKGGSKAAWIAQFFSWLRTKPSVQGFVWFDYQKEADWLVNSSPAAKTAFIAGLPSALDG